MSSKKPHPATPEDEVRQEVECFAAIREVRKQGGVPFEGPMPKRGRMIERTPDEQVEHERTLRREAVMLSMAAKALPKKRGAKKRHTLSELMKLLRGFNNIKARTPEGTTDKKAIESFLRAIYKIQGKRISHVDSKKVQAEIKTIMNLLADARKLAGEPRHS